MPFAGGNQTPQTGVDVSAPAVGADVVTLIFGDQTHMSETDFGLVALFGDGEINRRVGPFPGLVLSKTEVIFEDMPPNSLAGTSSVICILQR